ncbi:unnamed protein product [Auanema sp. JU1783]|nr:unnamed protein product [Auanema sp. JU1783]
MVGFGRNFDLSPGISRFSAARLYTKRGTEKVLVTPKRKESTINLPLTRSAPKFRAAKSHPAPLRKSITPGTILIVLAGKHKGKRVVFLKQLNKSGTLLCTGPHKINAFPLRRIAQSYVIATKTQLDISGVKVPDHINDEYFKRKTVSTRKGENIFASGKVDYVVTEQRKTDQKAVDKAILESIKKNKDAKALFGYLGTRFALQKGQYPHKLLF